MYLLLGMGLGSASDGAGRNPDTLNSQNIAPLDSARETRIVSRLRLTCSPRSCGMPTGDGSRDIHSLILFDRETRLAPATAESVSEERISDEMAATPSAASAPARKRAASSTWPWKAMCVPRSRYSATMPPASRRTVSGSTMPWAGTAAFTILDASFLPNRLAQLLSYRRRKPA